ncbi:Plasmodium vivax Vir protein, putative [Plasmodium vivax]|uniref:Vir protein, putative n=1 Tax=Plasmodium vivax TaxID=5855 RepID=A0A1G4E690_PLAVI|nr:Plasmodium vivax Vir protein, putative [Plasmodium vivax]
MTPICVKYLRFLDDSELWSDSSFEYDVSILLNYWLYDKIAAIYGITDIATISIDFSALQMVWDHFMESRKRKPYNEKFKPNTDIFYEEDWEKRRKLYEYYVNYDELFGIDMEGPLVTTGGPTAESNTQLESENFEIGKKVSHTVLGAAPVLLTATMLYRVPGFVDSVEAEQLV